VRENEISLRKWSGGTTHLRSSAHRRNIGQQRRVIHRSKKIRPSTRLLSLIKSLHDDRSLNLIWRCFLVCLWVGCAVKQSYVLVPTLFGIFFSAVLHHVLNDDDKNVIIKKSFPMRTRTELQIVQPCKTMCQNKNSAHPGMWTTISRRCYFRFTQRNRLSVTKMDPFAAADEAVFLVISNKRIVAMHQLTCTDTPQANINVNGTTGLKSRPPSLLTFFYVQRLLFWERNSVQNRESCCHLQWI